MAVIIYSLYSRPITKGSLFLCSLNLGRPYNFLKPVPGLGLKRDLADFPSVFQNSAQPLCKQASAILLDGKRHIEQIWAIPPKSLWCEQAQLRKAKLLPSQQVAADVWDRPAETRRTTLLSPYQIANFRIVS